MQLQYFLYKWRLNLTILSLFFIDENSSKNYTNLPKTLLNVNGTICKPFWIMRGCIFEFTLIIEKTGLTDYWLFDEK